MDLAGEGFHLVEFRAREAKGNKDYPLGFVHVTCFAGSAVWALG